LRKINGAPPLQIVARKLGFALFENEEHYRDLVENSFDLITTHDLNGVLLSVNLAAARILGFEPHELVQRNLREFLSPRLQPELEGYLTQIQEKGTVRGFVKLRSKSGEPRIWEYTNTLRTEGVAVPFVRAMGHDVTDILHAQKKLRDSEERLRVAAEVGKMYAWEWDPETDSVRRSAECAGILGVNDPDIAVASEYFSYVHPEDKTVLWKLVGSLTPENPAYRTEYRRLRSDGAQLWLEESGRATFDNSGKMMRLVGMTADITERKTAEEKLKASEEHSKEIVLRSPVAMIVTHGLEQVNELLNDKFTALFGYSKEDVPTVAQWWELAYPNAAYRQTLKAEWQARVAEAIETCSEIAPMEAEVCCKDGSRRYIEFHFTSFGETGLVSFVDLTDRKKAERTVAKVGGWLIEAQEEERTRIARDLHDNICQRLALLAIELEQLSDAPPKTVAAVRKEVNKLQERVSEISKDVIAISHELHPSRLDLLGLKGAVQGLCKEIGASHKVKIQFVEKSMPRGLPREIAICLFRIAQEALRNGVRHSRAERFYVELTGIAGSVELRIRDEGVGFDAEAARNHRSLGLISMRERIGLVHGTIEIRSKAEKGTEIHCKVPLPAAVESAAREEGRLAAGTNELAKGNSAAFDTV
jgi:PAS domain S-box-containing protein